MVLPATSRETISVTWARQTSNGWLLSVGLNGWLLSPGLGVAWRTGASRIGLRRKNPFWPQYRLQNNLPALERPPWQSI